MNLEYLVQDSGATKMNESGSASSRLYSQKKVNTILFGLAVLAASTRGIIEVFAGRVVGYVVQIVLICIPLLLIELNSRRVDPDRKFLHRYGPSAEFSLVIFFSILSILMTGWLEGIVGLQYLLVLCFTWLMLGFSCRQIRKPTISFRLAFWLSTGVALLLASVAFLQQLLIFPFRLPGYTSLFDIIRPPSVTASYLHYPLIISIAACNCYMAFLRRIRWALLPLVILVLATFASFSRSGMLILIAAFGLSIIGNRKQFGRSILVLAMLAGLLSVLNVVIDSESLSVYERLTSSVDTGSLGNETRYEIWLKAMEYMGPLNLVMGTYFGLITNSAPDEVRNVYSIVESSPLQQILNIGLVGTVLFYHSFYRMAVSLPSQAGFAKFILAAAAIQSLFYQSIEVIPFLMMITTTAVLAAADDE